MIVNPVVYGSGGSRSITAVGNSAGTSVNDIKYIQFVVSEEDKKLVLDQKSLSGAIVHGDISNNDEIQCVYLYPNDGGEGTESFVHYTSGLYVDGTMNADVSVSGFSGGLLRISVTIHRNRNGIAFGPASKYYLFLDIKE